jgi:hypothetical protein
MAFPLWKRVGKEGRAVEEFSDEMGVELRSGCLCV